MGHVALLPEGEQPEARTPGPVDPRVHRAHVARGVESERDDARARLALHPRHVRVVAVQHGRPVRRQRPDHPRLLVARDVERSEAPVVLAADRRHDRDVGQDDARVLPHLSLVRDADLDHRVALATAMRSIARLIEPHAL